MKNAVSPGAGICDAIDLPRDALGGEGNRGQGILDFVRHAAGHLVPGSRFLRAQQFAGVLQHDDESGGKFLLQGGGGNRNLQLARGVAHFELPRGRAGAAGALHEVFDFRGIVAREKVFETSGPGDGFGRQDFRKCPVDALDRTVGGNRNYAGRNTLENRFGETVAAVEFAAAGFEPRGHLIEVADEGGRVRLPRAHLRGGSRLPLRTSLGGMQKRGNRNTDLSRQKNERSR